MHRIKLLFLILGTSFSVVATVSSQTWTPTQLGGFYSIASSADGQRLVTVGRGGIFTSTNSGSAWTQQTGAPSLYWYSVASSADGNKLAAGSEYGPVYTSTDGGVTWAPTLTPSTWWTSIACSADGSTVVAAQGHPGMGLIFTSTDSGNTWSSNSPSLMWSGVASSADGTKLAAVDVTGDIFTSADSGASWQWRFGDTGLYWDGVASSADGTMLVATLGDGGIYRSTDSGISWTPTLAPSKYWDAIASSADGTRLLAVGDSPDLSTLCAIYTSTNSGGTWVSNNTPNFGYWSAATMSADGHGMAAAYYDVGIYTFQTIPSPQLSLAASGSNLDVSWLIPSTPMALQQSSDLISWTNITSLPALNLTNLRNHAFFAASNTASFFRLAAP
jgi:hypothetical protein